MCWSRNTKGESAAGSATSTTAATILPTLTIQYSAAGSGARSWHPMGRSSRAAPACHFVMSHGRADTSRLGISRLAARDQSPAWHRDERGAQRARRDDREYREYLSEEQRRPRGCLARRLQPDSTAGCWGRRIKRASPRRSFLHRRRPDREGSRCIHPPVTGW
jgi:hypothetical protein